MDINDLLDDEVLAECEVRNLSDASSKGITATLKNALQQKFEEESNDPLGEPLLAPVNVSKQPKREARICANKLQELKGLLLAEEPNKEVTPAMLKTLGSRLEHVHGRLVRISYSPAVKQELTRLFQATRELSGVLNGLSAKTIKFPDAIGRLTELKIPDIPMKFKTGKSSKEIQNREADQDEQELQPTGLERTDTRVGVPSTSFRQSVSLQPELHTVANLEARKAEIEEQLASLSMDNTFHSGLRSNMRQRQSSVSSAITDFDLEDDRPATLPLAARVCRDPSTWGLKFDNSNGTTHIERFFYRVERMATRSYIQLDHLVDYMTLLLSGEALEWYWVYLERNKRVSWQQLKGDMIQRFQMSRTDEDVRRLMSQRKQMYPRESFQEYYDAILGLALQSTKPLSDQNIYLILRRNMRPGLQLELHNQIEFPSLSHFLKRCLDLEDLWKRFGANPEASLNLNRSSNYSAPGRFQPKIHEITDDKRVYLNNITENYGASGSGEQYSEHQPPANYGEATEQDEVDGCHPSICAMHASRIKPQTAAPFAKKFQQNSSTSVLAPGKGISVIRLNENQTSGDAKGPRCWNCSSPEHLFYDCRTPIQHVFCFGCGTKGVYRPDCPNCYKRQGNLQVERRESRQPLLGNKPPNTPTTSEAAANTDPELYQRQLR